MKNEMIKVKGSMYERLLVTDDLLYLTISTYKDKEMIETQLNKSTKMSGIKKITFDSINKIEFNEGEAEVDVHYTNEKGKAKKQKITFDRKEGSNDFGNFLGGELMFNREIRDEKRMPKLLGNGIVALAAIGFLIYFINEANFNSFLEMENSHSRSGRKAEFIKVILAMAGHKVSLGIMLLVAGLTGKNAYDEFKKPSQVVSYTRV